MTTAPSVYPRTVDDLMPEARKVPLRDGELVPSQRRLMAVLNVGQEKAKEIRARLIEEGVQRDIKTEPVGNPARLLRPVVERAEATGTLPTAEDLTTEYGIGQGQAELLAELARVAVERRASGLPAELDPWWAAPENPNGFRPDPVSPASAPVVEPEPTTPPAEPVQEPSEPVRVDVDPDDTAAPVRGKPVVVWPVWVMLAPAFVSIWAGWVGLGERTGYGLMNLLPGFTDKDGGPLLVINTAITLPVGMEVYGAYALYVWLSGRVPAKARTFAMWSAFISLGVGALGQIAFHLMEESNVQATPAWITIAVSCVPVAVLGMGAALAHLVRNGDES